MGVVRRDGKWRLEKLEEGHYEVTHQQKPQAKVLTTDYSPGMMDDASFALIPVHEVSSYAEAEGIFEEYAHGGQPDGLTSIGGGNSSPGSFGDRGNLGLEFGSDDRNSFDFDHEDGDSLADVENLPPGGIAVVLLFAGGLLLSMFGFAPNEPMSLLGAGLVGLGIMILAWALIIFRSRGWRDAVEFLVTVDNEKASSTMISSDGSEEPKTTPPAPEKLKNELIFGRAAQDCEWCGEHLDNPEVHHIEPRSEGGPNEPKNLIVLCPTCHRKADNGGISRTKLRGKLRYILSEQR